MSTNVRIKQKALFKKKLEMKDIVALTVWLTVSLMIITA